MLNTDALTRPALDLSWSWNHSADDVWKKLHPLALGPETGRIVWQK